MHVHGEDGILPHAAAIASVAAAALAATTLAAALATRLHDRRWPLLHD